MSDQNVVGTPGSNVDMSVNGNSKSHTPKDKACPFCLQQFTSSSLGRHLDLYIKEKNPKPADGLHDIDEIRKMRGGITRRQPRIGTTKRENSTSNIGMKERKSPRLDPEREKNHSPTARRFDIKAHSQIDHRASNTKMGTYKHGGTWDSPGGINNNSAQWGSDARSWEGEERDHNRRPMTRGRSVSRKIIAKTSHEQKQKMIEALDNARAAELALRELAGSVRAAKQQIQAAPVLDFDPLTMDFPALCLQCLLPPPTLNTSTPIPSPTSWSLSPPDDSQYQAIRKHFTSLFHNYRMTFSLPTTSSKQDTSFPVSTQHSIPTSNQTISSAAISAANQLEIKVNAHLQAIYRAWQALPLVNQTEIWTISLARSIAFKSNQIDELKRQVERVSQEAAHLRQQVEELSRVQYPREFRAVPPRTTHVEGEVISVLGEQIFDRGVEGRAQGDNPEISKRPIDHLNDSKILDGNVQLDTAVECVIARWKNIVKDIRTQLGGTNDSVNFDRSLNAQQRLVGDNLGGQERIRTANLDIPNDWGRTGQSTKNNINAVGIGSDADADADMEEEDTSSFVEMVDAPPVMHPQPYSQQILHQNHHHQQDHHQSQPQLRNHGQRINNSNSITNANTSVNNSCSNGGHYSPEGK